MMVGIEARSLSHPQPGGFKTYVRNLIWGLARSGTRHRYFIYLDRPMDEWPFEQLDPACAPVVTNNLPAIGQIYREQCQLPRSARAHGCDIMHYTTNRGPVRSAVPFVLTLHDIIALAEKPPWTGWSRAALWQWLLVAYNRLLIPLAVRECDAVITVSEFERGQIVERFHVPLDKIHVTHLAAGRVFKPLSTTELNRSRGFLQREYGITPGYFLAIGYEPRKNIGRVLEAHARLAEGIRTQHKLLIVCAREYVRNAWQRQIDARRWGGLVKVIGAVDHQQLVRLYNLASALVFPSLRESFGLPPIEAMACGTPVIASSTSSIPEIVEDAGLLVNPTDVPALADAMAAVVRRPGLADELREKGLRRSRQFSWEKTARKTISVYEQVLSTQH